METSDPPPGQLYLSIPHDMDAAALEALLEGLEAACLLIRRPGPEAATPRAPLERLRPLAQARGLAVLLEDEPELAAALGCDGVHLGDPAALARARRILGPEASIGVACGASRHAAMVAGEGGADYVAFGRLAPPEPPELADPALVAWWHALMTLPCVALGARSPAEHAVLLEAGADFIAVEPALARHLAAPGIAPGIARPGASC